MHITATKRVIANSFFISPLRSASCQNGVARVLRGLLFASAGLLCALAFTGCGSLPSAVERPPSAALAPRADGELATLARNSTPPGAQGQSGFRLLPLGSYSLDTRLQLIQRAQHSLDVQYYVIENDLTGRTLMRELRNAARRGVRVRLLVDDLFTAHTDALLLALAHEPNLQVRLFNPFCCNRGSTAGRFLGSVQDIYRLNHRMHNKLFIADGLAAVAGGRNIADEYFMLHASGNFVDMDTFILGAVLPELQGLFDKYWNSNVVYPVQAIVKDELGAAQTIAAFEAATAGPPLKLELPASDVLGYGALREDFDAGRTGLVWASARAFADPPNKRDTMSAEEAALQSVSYEVRMKVWAAADELVITSPYLIPGPLGIGAFEALGQRKVQVTLLTNSLAATDEPLVHTGYARYRERLLRYGVDLYELSPERTRRGKRLGVFGSSLGRLHAKTAIVDKRTVFIGSMNLDPRSQTQNTELGLFIDSPELAKELARVITISKTQSAYRLRLNPNTQAIEWQGSGDEGDVVYTSEPESSFWMRLHNMLIAPFVPEQLL